MENTFFNTTNESGNELKERRRKANSQAEKVLNLFKENKDLKLTPAEIHQHLINYCDVSMQTPLTSTRRAISVLTKKEKLTKLLQKKAGLFGVSNHLWTLNLQPPIMCSNCHVEQIFTESLCINCFSK